MPKRRSRLGMQLGITAVALAVLGLVGWVGWSSGGLNGLLHPAHSLSQPGSIGTLTKVDGGGVDVLVQRMESQFAGGTGQTVAGVYGTGNVPRLIFVASQAKGSTESPAQLTTAVNASGTPFTAPPVVSNVAGQPYVCGRVGAQPAPAVLCAWTDSNAAGFVFTINSNDVPGTLSLAAQARDAAER